MSGISAWALSVSICSVISCIVEMLVNDTRLEKTVRFVLGGFMLCAIIIPFGNAVQGMSEITIDKTQTQNSTQNLYSQEKVFLQTRMSKLVAETLKKQKINPIKTSVIMDINEHDGIKIVSVSIELEKTDAKKITDIKNVLKTDLGIEPDCVIINS